MGILALFAEPAGNNGSVTMCEPDGLGASCIDGREQSRPVSVVG